MAVALILGFFLCGIGTFLIFDAVLRVQYRKYREEWELDGKPHGFFFVPKELRKTFMIPNIKSTISMNVRYFALIFSTPAWATNEPRLVKLLRIYRLVYVLAVLSWVGVVILLGSKNQ